MEKDKGKYAAQNVEKIYFGIITNLIAASFQAEFMAHLCQQVGVQELVNGFSSSLSQFLKSP